VHATLTKLYPQYFQHFDLAEGLADTNPLEVCRAYGQYMNTHTKPYRPEILAAGKNRLVLSLHQQEAEFEEDLRWLKKVIAAYDFHIRSAQRQNANLERDISTLRQPEILLWLDWKQNVLGLHAVFVADSLCSQVYNGRLNKDVTESLSGSLMPCPA